MSDNDKKIKEFIEPMIFDERPDPKPTDPVGTDLIKGMDFDVRTKGFEEKTYIILYKIDIDPEDDSMHENCYSVRIGRTEAYNDIKEKLLSGVNVDIHRSRIITETKETQSSTGDRKYFLMALEDCISIYSFCIGVSEYYSNDPFNIEDFNNKPIPDDPNPMLSDLPNYLTPEQEEYRQMLEESISRRDMFNNLEGSSKNSINI